MSAIRAAVDRYRALFGADAAIVVRAPGRVNLIGEHTDYNQGLVLPMAIERSVLLAAGPREDGILAIHSTLSAETVEVPLSRISRNPGLHWSDYLKGVAAILLREGYRIRGANICVHLTLPIASGLSSSAAIEVAGISAFRHLNGLPFEDIDLIRLARAAEVEFVGVHCGIMDQFVSMAGKKGHALFLDCRDLTHEHVRLPPGGVVVLCPTGVRRELAGSVYNDRRDECAESVRQLAALFPSVKSLRDVSMEEFRRASDHLSPVPRKRAAHVVAENERVVRFVEAMRRSDLSLMGSLMTASHESLRDEFEVSCPELNAVVEIACGQEGVYGARMTGAGFGGCAICLVEETFSSPLMERLSVEYPRRTGLPIHPEIVAAAGGASIIVAPANALRVRTDRDS